MRAESEKSVSILVPTYHEVDNIAMLVERIAKVDFQGWMFDVVIIDDNSQDGTEEMVEKLRQRYAWLHIVVRKCQKGLSRSILEGFKQRNPLIYVVMDADLSHPPEKIPALLTALSAEGVEMVIGSRYVLGGSSDTAWSFVRKCISRAAAFMARGVIALPVKDPLSGFLAIKRTTLDRARTLDPIGWKIGLELMVKCQCQHVIEIPIHFSEREKGQSKLTFGVIMAYFKHLYRLFFYQWTHRHLLK